MTEKRVGLWLIGACGGVGTTATLGLSAIARGVSDTTSLVTALPMFEPLRLDGASQFVVGGHEIRRACFRQTVSELQQRSNIFAPEIVEACQTDLEAWEANLRPGTLLNCGPAIARLSDREDVHHSDTAREAIERIQNDLRTFQNANKLEQVVVVNVSSTEAPFEIGEVHESLEKLAPALDRGTRSVVPRIRCTPRKPEAICTETG